MKKIVVSAIGIVTYNVIALIIVKKLDNKNTIEIVKPYITDIASIARKELTIAKNLEPYNTGLDNLIKVVRDFERKAQTTKSAKECICYYVGIKDIVTFIQDFNHSIVTYHTSEQ